MVTDGAGYSDGYPHPGEITQKDRDFGKRLEAEARYGLPTSWRLEKLDEWIQLQVQRKLDEIQKQLQQKELMAKMSSPQKSDARPLNETLKEWEARMKRTYQRPVTTREKMKFIKEHLPAEKLEPKPSAFKRFLARLGGHRG